MSMPSKLQPKGLEPFPPKEIPLDKLKPVQEPALVPIKDKVNWFDLIKEFVRQNLINDVLNLQKGVTMSSKAWYLSKTLWTNFVLLAWQFIGPLIGIPTIDPELMAGILAIVNFLLRLITKSPVGIS